MGGAVTERVAGVAILAVMARLVEPGDYGLFGMVLALTGLLSLLSDMGLPLAAIQKDGLTHSQLSNVFWLNVAVGLILGLLVLGAAPMVARFYSQPALTTVTTWCALSYPLEALGAQHGALLQRRMAFGRLALCSVVGLVGSGAIGIWLARDGLGVRALVAQQVFRSALTAAGYWVAAAWLPGLPSRRSGVLGMVRIGGYVTAFNLVNYFARNLDNILLGRFWGPTTLGLYSRAYTLMTYPVSLISAPVSRAALPALARLQSDPDRLRNAYLRVLQFIGFLSFPLMGLLLVCADDVVLVVYGPSWREAAPLFRILCVAGFWQGIYNATGQVFVASGRTDRMFRCGLWMSAATVVAFLVGVRAGAEGVSIAYSAVFCCLVFPYLRYTYATIGLSLAATLKALGPALGSTAIACTCVGIALHLGAGLLVPAARLATAMIAGGAVYLIALSLVAPGLTESMLGGTVGDVLARARGRWLQC